MAVVLYQGGDEQPKTGASASAAGTKGGDAAKLENIHKRIEALTANVRPHPYIGLQNQGATCYMNSLIQTLFMTPQVRQHIYSYKYDPDIHGSKDYCIPYQLQRLFANLQLSRDTWASTKALTKSFHWTSSESFQQQDVQEFCRVLFDAIDKSFNLRLSHDAGLATSADFDEASMTQLYEGVSQSFVKCLECGNESIRQDNFQDLSLPIRNEFGTGVQNSSVEMALENYIKPEILDGDNQYCCDQCSKKVDAEKGIKLVAGPPVLTIALNRFTLDYTTFQRVKILDRVSFGQVINLNDYLNGYENIKNKKYEEEVERMNKFQASQVAKNKNQEAVKTEKLQALANKKQDEEMKDESAAASQLQNEESKEEESSNLVKEVINGEVVTTIKPQAAAQETTTASSYKPKEQQVKITVGQQDPIEENQPGDIAKGSFDEVSYNKYLLDDQGPKKVIDYSRPMEDDVDLSSFNNDIAVSSSSATQQEAVDGAYRMKHTNEKFSIGGGHPSRDPVDGQAGAAQQQQPLTEEEELQRALEQIREMENRELIVKEATTEQVSKVSDYVQQGEFVYELYSIMIHSGGAYGGHYYAYIKSFEDGKWYNFNDSHVTELPSEEDIFKTFGDSKGSSGTAYLLMYRKITGTEEPEPFPSDLVPEYLKSEIEAEAEKLIKEQRAIEEKLLNLTVKVFHEEEGKHISVRKTQTLHELILMVYEQFGITWKEVTDCRLRAYDAIMKVRLGVFENYQQPLLEMKELYGRSTLDLEFKDEQSGNFEEYNPNWLHLRALKWEDGLNYDYARPDSIETTKIRVDPKKETVAQLDQKLSEALDIPVENCIVFLRHEHGYNGTASTEYYNMEWRKNKLIQEVSKFDHGTVLFVEHGVHGQKFDEYKWQNEFALEAQKITVSVNDVKNDIEGLLFNIKISLPRTSPMQRLKEEVGKRFSLEMNEFHLVRNTNDKEIKEMSMSLTQAGLTSHSMVKVVLGPPSLEGAYNVKLSSVALTDDATDKGNQIFTVKELGEITLIPEETGLQFKMSALALYNSLQEDGAAQLEIDGFRMRAPRHNFGDIVYDNEMMENLQLFDDKEFYVQVNQPEKLVTYEPIIEDPTKILHVLVREWDSDTWQFGPVKEVQVPRNMKSVDFGKYLQSKVFPHIESDNLFATKISFLKSFVRSDLAMRGWQSLTRSTNAPIAQGKLELTKDGSIIIVRDHSKPIRETLTEEEIKKYTNSTFVDHIKRKLAADKNMMPQHKNYDALLEAAQSRKPDYNKKPARPEVGVSIQVGIQQNDAPKVEDKADEDMEIIDFEPFF